MDKLISVIIGAVIFYIVLFMLVPMLPEPARAFVSLIVVVIGIVYLLSMLTGYSFPWKK